eukprot:1157539-Pelagomonas_calceolata.AAC.9
MLLIARLWSRVLPVTLQIPISLLFFVALWWRRLAAGPVNLFSEGALASLLDVNFVLALGGKSETSFYTGKTGMKLKNGVILKHEGS